MNKFKYLTLILIALFVLIGIVFYSIRYLKPKPAGLKINTTPVSSVYINGVFMGKTPYTGTNPVSQIGLKLIPDNSTDKTLFPYETKINLVSGIQTVVDREFGGSEELSSGDVISFDKIGGESTGLVVVSNPDNSQVWIDGKNAGFTPFSTTSILSGTHKISVKNNGYSDRTLNIKIIPGLRLTLFAKLSKAVEPTPSPTPVPESEKVYVIIKDTPTGFLRMRTEPGKLGEEIAELKPGSKYLFLDRDATSSGWFKIQYQNPAPGLPNGIVGWVSNQYSSLSTPNPSSLPVTSN